MPPLVFDEDAVREAIDRVVDRTFRMDFNWDWPGGVAFYGVCEAYEATGNSEYIERVKSWIDEQLEDGLPKLSVNGVSIGHALISLYQYTEDGRYLDAARKLADYLANEAPRFGDGIIQHTVNSVEYQFPEQAWVDTMMMAGLFLVRFGHLLGAEGEGAPYFRDGIRQYHGHEDVLQDETTNLYYHGWDNINRNHMSGVYWARGNAWAALTMAKALPLIHVADPAYMIIDGSLRDLLSALVRLQGEDGLWHTVLTDPTSYDGDVGFGGHRRRALVARIAVQQGGQPGHRRHPRPDRAGRLGARRLRRYGRHVRRRRVQRRVAQAGARLGPGTGARVPRRPAPFEVARVRVNAAGPHPVPRHRRGSSRQGPGLPLFVWRRGNQNAIAILPKCRPSPSLANAAIAWSNE